MGDCGGLQKLPRGHSWTTAEEPGHCHHSQLGRLCQVDLKADLPEGAELGWEHQHAGIKAPLSCFDVPASSRSRRLQKSCL